MDSILFFLFVFLTLSIGFLTTDFDDFFYNRKKWMTGFVIFKIVRNYGSYSNLMTCGKGYFEKKILKGLDIFSNAFKLKKKVFEIFIF